MSRATDTGTSSSAAPSASGGAGTPIGQPEVDQYDEELDRGGQELIEDLRALTRAEHGGRGGPLRHGAGERQHPPRGLLAASPASTRSVTRGTDSTASHLPAVNGPESGPLTFIRRSARRRRRRSCRAARRSSSVKSAESRTPFARSIPRLARSRTSSSAPVGGDPVAERLRRLRIQPAQLDRLEPGIEPPGEDQRQRDGAVEQVGAPRLAGPLRRTGDVEHVVEQLEGEPDLPAEGGDRPRRRAARGEAADPAGGLEEARRLQRAAPQVALLADRGVVGVAALGELARAPGRRRPS